MSVQRSGGTAVRVMTPDEFRLALLDQSVTEIVLAKGSYPLRVHHYGRVAIGRPPGVSLLIRAEEIDTGTWLVIDQQEEVLG